MTLLEFTNEFRFKYDAASNGGPDLNTYEISLCLTQAAKDIIDDAYNTYETNERSKRILAPLLREHTSVITPNTDDYTNFICYLISLPTDKQYIVREEAILDNCNWHIKIEHSDIDHLTEYLLSPFKKPNKRKIVRAEYSDNQFKIYTEIVLKKYKIKYIKNNNPIIIMDFSLDPTLIGNESISGLTVATNTELPEFIHDEIIDKAVIIAIKTLRNNSLQSQIQVP